MNKEKRTLFMQIRVSPSEKKKIMENALESKIPYSDYIRSVSLAGYHVRHQTAVTEHEVFEVEPGSMQIRRVGEMESPKTKKHATG